MAANIEFKNNQGEVTNVETITLSDGIGNTYTLGAEKDGLRLKYKPSGQEEVEYKVEGLAAALGSLFNVKSDSSEEITVLQEKVAEKPIVEAIFNAIDPLSSVSDKISTVILDSTFARKDIVSSKLQQKADKEELNRKADAANVYTKTEIDEELNRKADAANVYTKTEIDEELNRKADADTVYTKEQVNKGFLKSDRQEIKKLAREVLGQRGTDAQSILVSKLGEFLDSKYVLYGSEKNQTARDFLAEKGEFTKTDGSNIRIPDFTNKILGATEDIEEGKKKSILVEQLGEFLDKTNDDDKAYDGKIAKDFLGEKGMQGPKGTDGAQGPAGRDGESPSASDVAAQLFTEKKDELASTLLAIDNNGQNLATQVADKIKIDEQGFLSKIDEIMFTKEIVNKLNLDDAKQIIQNTVGAMISDATKENNPDPEAFKKYEKFAEKLAELLVNRSSISEKEADALVGNKVSEWALARYLILRSGLDDSASALTVVQEKVNREKLAEWLLEYAELKDVDSAKDVVQKVVDYFFSQKATELGQAVLGAKDGKGVEILVNSPVLQEGVAEKLRENPGNAKGPRGDPGQDGKSLSPSVVAQELITNKVTELGQAILNIKRADEEQPALETDLANNSSFQESVAGNQDLRDAVTTTLKSDGAFHSIVKRDLSENGESLSVNDIVTQLLGDKDKTLIDAIGNDKEVVARILGATDTDGRKSILVEKLAKFLGANDQVYDSDKKTAKEFLNSKGLASSIDTSDPNFYGAVREIISRPYFEIPDDPKAPLSWEW